MACCPILSSLSLSLLSSPAVPPSCLFAAPGYARHHRFKISDMSSFRRPTSCRHRSAPCFPFPYFGRLLATAHTPKRLQEEDATSGRKKQKRVLSPACAPAFREFKKVCVLTTKNTLPPRSRSHSSAGCLHRSSKLQPLMPHSRRKRARCPLCGRVFSFSLVLRSSTQEGFQPSALFVI